jgi:hypothetical protein
MKEVELEDNRKVFGAIGRPWCLLNKEIRLIFSIIFKTVRLTEKSILNTKMRALYFCTTFVQRNLKKDRDSKRNARTSSWKVIVKITGSE